MDAGGVWESLLFSAVSCEFEFDDGCFGDIFRVSCGRVGGGVGIASRVPIWRLYGSIPGLHLISCERRMPYVRDIPYNVSPWAIM